jgi:predicted MPP superfamily phosphohydrolase
MLLDLEKLKTKHFLEPDLIVFSGDLVQRGSDGPDAFKSVSTELIEPLLNQLNLTQDQFFCCPGNHDVDRTKVFNEVENGIPTEVIDSASLDRYYQSCVNDPVRLGNLQRKLESFEQFQKAYASQHVVESNFFYSTSIVPIRGTKVGITSFNSAWRSSHLGSDKGRLILGLPIVEEASERIQDCDLKLAIVHHPQDWLEEWDQRETRNQIAKHFNIGPPSSVHDDFR